MHSLHQENDLEGNLNFKMYHGVAAPRLASMSSMAGETAWSPQCSAHWTCCKLQGGQIMQLLMIVITCVKVLFALPALWMLIQVNVCNRLKLTITWSTIYWGSFSNPEQPLLVLAIQPSKSPANDQLNVTDAKIMPILPIHKHSFASLGCILINIQ